MDKYKVKVNPAAIRELDHIYEYSPIKSVTRADMPEKATVSY